MTDDRRDERGQDVADRLARRFGGPDGTEDSGSTDDSESADRSDGDSSQAGEGSERPDSAAADSSTRSDTAANRAANVKEAWESTFIYLPDEEPTRIHSRLHREFDRLTYECARDLEWKPKKNRHYYPVVALDGVEAVEEMSAEEFRDRAIELGLR